MFHERRFNFFSFLFFFPLWYRFFYGMKQTIMKLKGVKGKGKRDNEKSLVVSDAAKKLRLKN